LKEIFRKIYGSINDNGTWHIIYNHELYQLYEEPNAEKVVKAGRLRWLVHLFRLEDMNPCKKSTFTKPENITRGRPSVRWLDSTEQDLEVLRARET
jgi:hypothetical protein